MEPEVLLAQLRALLERAPNLMEYTVSSREHLMWLGQAHALISQWNRVEAIGFTSSSEDLSRKYNREKNVDKIHAIIYRAIGDLELKAPARAQEEFGSGDVYDFFKTLNKVIATAESSIFIIDPYLDATVFDHYLTSRNEDVSIKLLTNKSANSLLPSKDKYIAQFGNVLEIRKSKKLHDRVIFIDDYVCWLIGQSIKDAAKAKPTYLVPASPDIVPAKIESYNEIWTSATIL